MQSTNPHPCAYFDLLMQAGNQLVACVYTAFLPERKTNQREPPRSLSGMAINSKRKERNLKPISKIWNTNERR